MAPSPLPRLSTHARTLMLVVVFALLATLVSPSLATAQTGTDGVGSSDLGVRPTEAEPADTGDTAGTDDTDDTEDTDELNSTVDRKALEGAGDGFTLNTAELGLGRSIRMARPAGQTEFIVPTPPGLLLTEISTSIVIPSNVSRTFVSISVNDEVVFEEIIEGGTRREITAQIEPAAGDSLVQVKAEEYAGQQCTSPIIEPLAAELLNPTFLFRAQPSLPETVSDFLPQVIQGFEILVDQDRPAHVDEAVMLLATHLTTAYPVTPSFVVREIPSNLIDSISTDPFTRTIVLADADVGRVDVQGNDEVAFLRLAGPEGLLSDIASSINEPEIRLISSDEVATVGEREIDEEELKERRTLREAGVRRLEASDAVRLQLPIPLPQARFGQPINRIRVRLGGVLVHATPADVEPVVTVWVNDDLLSTIELDRAGRFDTELEISGNDLRRDNLVVVRSELPLDCGFGLPTHQLQLDSSSWVDVDYGQSIPVGLDRYPQSLLPEFQVRPGQSIADLQVTANLLAVMQSSSPLILDPQIASWDDIVRNDLPGILVGGSSDQLEELLAPISAAGGSVDVSGVEFVAADGYDRVTVLQALVGPLGQDIMHLQLAVEDGKDLASTELSEMLVDRGWGRFSGQAFAVNDGATVVVPADPNADDIELPTLSTDAPAPTRRIFGFGILGSLVLIGLLIVSRALYARVTGKTRNPVGMG